MAALAAFLPNLLFGQAAMTDPVGFLSDSIPANSDVALAVPFTRAPVFQARISSISDVTATDKLITLTGTPNFRTTSPKQFEHVAGTQPNTYYAQIKTGTKAGLLAPIVNNTTNGVTVRLSPGDNLSGVLTEATAGAGAGDKIIIQPYWTPATLFPSSWPNGTQVLLYDGGTAGVNIAASAVLFYTGTQWLDLSTFQDAGEVILHPTESFLIRNNSAQAIKRIVSGSVPLVAHRAIISTLAANFPQDNRIGYLSPAPELLSDSGLGFSSGDQLLVFSGTSIGVNKSASQILFYSGTKWFDQATFGDVTATFSLQPGVGYVYRKAATPTPQDFVWQRLQSYNR
jgi:uncharacterized protein (TIGR02597 family)